MGAEVFLPPPQSGPHRKTLAAPAMRLSPKSPGVGVGAAAARSVRKQSTAPRRGRRREEARGGSSRFSPGEVWATGGSPAVANKTIAINYGGGVLPVPVIFSLMGGISGARPAIGDRSLVGLALRASTRP